MGEINFAPGVSRERQWGSIHNCSPPRMEGNNPYQNPQASVVRPANIIIGGSTGY